MKVPNKIKTFACRACKEILPTKTKLAKGNVVAITTCDFCMIEAEDCMHVLRSCPPVHRVWRDCFLGVDFTHNVCGHVKRGKDHHQVRAQTIVGTEEDL